MHSFLVALLQVESSPYGPSTPLPSPQSALKQGMPALLRGSGVELRRVGWGGVEGKQDDEGKLESLVLRWEFQGVCVCVCVHVQRLLEQAAL